MATSTIAALPIPPRCRKAKDYPLSDLLIPKRNNLVVSSIIGSKLSLFPASACLGLSKHLSLTEETILIGLPTAKPERASETLPKCSAKVIKSFALGKLEAFKLKYPQTGTESILLGILVEGTSFAAKFLRANGITFYKVREETITLLGASLDLYFGTCEPPLTEPAQRAIDWAMDEKLKSGESGEITTTQLLVGILSEKESAGHKILKNLGFDDEKIKELSKSMNVD